MKRSILLLLSLILTVLLAAGCGGTDGGSHSAERETPLPAAEPEASPEKATVASADQMAPAKDVVDEDMVPVYASALREGTYDVTVDSSSSMFSITACELTVAEAQCSASSVISLPGQPSPPRRSASAPSPPFSARPS